ncbi:PREDICTED: gasdermin-A-like [Elephantulus edwardii]|uniref:gasdermin-A-like n=1 Tax=Elephantulus edwardii TaxID=28737 RepID=UPI0003F0CF82|nr:PREDICTED: gasdermin-A-like [Elephantulus edwardii]
MASLFQDATRALVRQLDPVGDLIPLNCIIDAACFQPFCLVRKKRKGTLFWGTQYVKTHFSLRDMLEPGTKLPVGGKRQNILDIQKLSIVNDLENLKKRKLRKPELSFLQKLRELGENLYMVTEAVETLKEATLEKGSKAEGGVSITLLTAVGLKGSLNFNNTINLPLGTILAFRLKQLIIGENSWDNEMTPRTLYRPEPATREHTGFRALQAEVEDELQALENLTSLRRSALLAELLALLGQAKELQKLEKAVDGALDLDQPVTPGILGGPGDAVLKWLQETSGKLNPMLAGNILYLLGALQEMSEEQQQLLAMSVEKEILPRQMKLMETILDQNFLREEVGPFRLHCELLGGFKGEELKVTQALVGLCNLDIQGDGPLYTWEPNALRPLCALYAALSIFRPTLAPAGQLPAHPLSLQQARTWGPGQGTGGTG